MKDWLIASYEKERNFVSARMLLSDLKHIEHERTKTRL